MGYTGIKLNVKLNNDNDIDSIKKFFNDDNCIERVDKGYASIGEKFVGFEDFEEVAAEISKTLNVNILACLVYDSDIAVMQGYVNGMKKYELVRSAEENVDTNIDYMAKDFFENSNADEIKKIIDEEYLYCEEMFYGLSEIVGFELIH